MDKKTIVVKDRPEGRSNLAEARTWQMGFALLKQVKEDKFEAIHPFSCCKDYLNDLIFTLHTGIEVQAYGIKTSKKDSKYLESGYGYLGFKILPYFHSRYGNVLPKFVEEYNTKGIHDDEKRLQDNLSKIEQLLHYVEEKLNVKERSQLKVAEDNYYVSIVPPYWLQHQYLISIYSLIIRLGQFYDGSISPKEFLDKTDHQLDAELWKGTYERLNYIIANGLWDINYDALKDKFKKGDMSSTWVHGAGINSIHRLFGDAITPYTPAPLTPEKVQVRFNYEPIDFEEADPVELNVVATDATISTIGGTINSGLPIEEGNTGQT